MLVGAALAIVVAGCGGGGDQDAVRADTCDSKPSEPTTQLAYRGDKARLAQTVPVLCDRLHALGVSHRVRLAAGDRVVVEVPRALPARVTVADVKRVARPGRLSVYDWEANVVGPGGRPRPADLRVTGGVSAGQRDSLTLYDAVRRAAQRPAKVEADNSRAGSLFFAVDPKQEQVHGAQGSTSLSAALARVAPASRSRAKVYEIKPDTVIVRAEPRPGVGTRADSWYVLQDDVAVDGGQISNPKQVFDKGPAGTGGPIVTFDFTAQGRKAWLKLTREIAERGMRRAGLLRGQSAADANQHFAMVLDDQIVSIPFIDFRANPAGIDGSNGSQIEGGFTISSARQLATLLKTGALPVALEPVGPTG